ncbi:hypothetical protein GCM10008940_02190 [Microbulbifer agarilyticus]
MYSAIFLIFSHKGLGDVLYDAKIIKVYSQSRERSSAHLIKLDKSLPEVCSLNRLYINLEDTELFSSALARYLADKSVDIIYQIDADPRSAEGHTANLTCKVNSIF